MRERDICANALQVIAIEAPPKPKIEAMPAKIYTM